MLQLRFVIIVVTPFHPERGFFFWDIYLSRIFETVHTFVGLILLQSKSYRKSIPWDRIINKLSAAGLLVALGITMVTLELSFIRIQRYHQRKEIRRPADRRMAIVPLSGRSPFKQQLYVLLTLQTIR